jgi:hypothetical protein
MSSYWSDLWRRIKKIITYHGLVSIGLLVVGFVEYLGLVTLLFLLLGGGQSWNSMLSVFLPVFIIFLQFAIIVDYRDWKEQVKRK